MLFWTSEANQARILTRVGLAVIAVVAMAVALIAVNPLRRDDHRIALVISTEYVGQGVADGSPVVVHGVRVGEVDAVSSRPEGGAVLRLRLARDTAAELTDTIGLDFRPANYFGITGVNLVPGAGGAPLRDGARLTLTAHGDYTMQSLLSRVGELSGDVVTPELVSVIDRATRYADGLTPMLETLLLVTRSVAKTQTIPMSTLVRNVASVAVATPSTVDAVTNLADRVRHTGLAEVDEQFFNDRFLATIQLASTGLFGTVGNLLSSNVPNLLPATEVVRTLTAPLPGVFAGEQIGATLVELRSRFQKMFQGNGEQRALRVHIILENLPAVAAPLQAMGANG